MQSAKCFKLISYIGKVISKLYQGAVRIFPIINARNLLPNILQVTLRSLFITKIEKYQYTFERLKLGNIYVAISIQYYYKEPYKRGHGHGTVVYMVAVHAMHSGVNIQSKWT